MSEAKIKRIFYWAELAVMLLTLIFIFTNSLRAPEESMEQSGAARGFLETVFSYDRPLGRFVLDNVRKIAHFAEYALLGLEVAIFVIFHLQNKCVKAILSIPAAMCVAVFDETLQYFSGRGPAIVDVWIDLGGFAAGSLTCYGVTALVSYFAAKRFSRSKGEVGDGKNN